MCYFDVILLSDVISSIGPKLSDADTYHSLRSQLDYHFVEVTSPEETQQLVLKNIPPTKLPA